MQEFASSTQFKDEFKGVSDRKSKERDDDKAWEFSDRQTRDYRIDYRKFFFFLFKIIFFN